MTASVCPIYDEKSSFIGIWALNPNFAPSLGTLAELMSLADPTLEALTKRPCRRVPNDNTEVGNGVRFEGGVFLMLDDSKAPNEELSRPKSESAYVLINHHGVACLMRCSRTDERIDTPPRRTLLAQPLAANAGTWFRDASIRGGPHAPADFNLFELPRHTLEDWARQVSAEPRQARCSVVRIRDLGRVPHVLFEPIKAEHQLDSSAAVALLDEYLGAACPECFSGLTGSVLQMLSTASSARTFLGAGEQFQRLLNGRCTYCASQEYYVIWHGDKKSPQQVLPERSDQRTPTKKEQRPTSLAVLAKDRLSSVLEDIRRSAPCSVSWLEPGLEGIMGIIVVVDCCDVDLASTFKPLGQLAGDDLRIIAGLLRNTLDDELSELVELEMREYMKQYGYAGDDLPVLRMEQCDGLGRIIRERQAQSESTPWSAPSQVGVPAKPDISSDVSQLHGEDVPPRQSGGLTLEACQHCGTRVLFTKDICPHCRKPR